MSLARFACPGCGNAVEALPSAEVIHECPKRNNRPTIYQRTTTGDEPMPTKPKPTLTSNAIRKGNAPRQAARQRAHVQKSVDKLEALKARQEDDGGSAPPAAPEANTEPGGVVNMGAAKSPDEPTVRFVVDGKPVGKSQNRLSSISRVTATADAPRWPASQFRAWLGEQGVTDPNHTEWEVTLPNGRKIAAVAG